MGAHLAGDHLVEFWEVAPQRDGREVQRLLDLVVLLFELLDFQEHFLVVDGDEWLT